MQTNWYVLIPPILVLSLSSITKKINESLIVGILAAAFLATHYSPYATITLAIQRLWGQISSLDNLYLFGFLLVLGTLITLLIHTGGTTAYSRFIERVVKTKRGVECSSLILSSIFIIDDYFSSLTIGSVMRNITDHWRIPRVKLAFLINAMAPAIAILPPVSSWIAMLLGQLAKAGISEIAIPGTIIIADPFFVYLNLIPYIFYSFIIIFSTWYLVYKQFSFGSMRAQEIIAQKTGNVFGGKEPAQVTQTPQHSDGSLNDFLIPIGLLISAVPLAILYSGGFYLFGGSHSLIEAMAKANIFFALFLGSSIALIISTLLFIVQKKCSLKEFVNITLEGSNLMRQSILVLLLAWTFSEFLKTDLPAGDYLAQSVLTSLPLFMLPLMFFVIASITAMSTGSSWGTIAVLIPLAVPMITTLMHFTPPVPLSAVSQLLLPVLGAILSGAVAGTHVCPIADSMIMSSISSGCHHIDHVQTQILYVTPAIIGTSISFLLIGLLSSAVSAFIAVTISFLVGLLCSCGLLHLLHYREHIKE